MTLHEHQFYEMLRVSEVLDFTLPDMYKNAG